MNSAQKQAIEHIIWQWLDDWVIGQNFCPFAKPVRRKGAIHIEVCDNASATSLPQIIAEQCQQLLNSPQRSTTLLALWREADDFYTYLDWVDSALAQIESMGLTDTFQLATFHPDYVFDAEPFSSPTNFTNRSPLPIIHILREDEISQVIPSQKEADSIVEKNKARCWDNGHAYFQSQLKAWQARLAEVAE